MVQVQLYPKFGTFSSFCFLIKLQEIPFVGSCPPFTFTPGHPVRWEAWRMPWSKNRPFVRSSKKQCVRRSNMCLEFQRNSRVAGFFEWEVLVVDFFLFRLGLCEIFRKETNKKLRAGWRFSRGYHLDISTNKGTFWSNKLTPNISMENSNLASPTSSSWEDNP